MTNFELRFAEDESLVSLSKSFQRNGPIFSVVNFLPLSLIFKIFCNGAISLKFVMKVTRKLHPSPFKRKKNQKQIWDTKSSCKLENVIVWIRKSVYNCWTGKIVLSSRSYFLAYSECKQWRSQRGAKGPNYHVAPPIRGI